MVRRSKEQIQKDNTQIEKISEALKNASEVEMRKIFIPLIMERQTEGEKQSKLTSQKNSKGLSAAHAPQITLYFDLINKGYKLFPIQVRTAKRILSHYEKQYLEIARQETA